MREPEQLLRIAEFELNRIRRCQNAPGSYLFLVMRASSFPILVPAVSACVLLIASCAQQPAGPSPEEVAAEAAKPKPLYEWHGDIAGGPKSVKIDIDQQKAFLYRGDREVGWTTVATGIYSHPTPTGNFKILEKTVSKRSNLWGKIYSVSGKVAVADARAGRDEVPEGGRFEGASMPYWMRLTGDGIGMHQGPIPRPGRRASHGCIRVHSGFVRRLFDFVEIGTPVSIVGTGPRWTPPKPAPKPAPEPAAAAQSGGSGAGDAPPSAPMEPSAADLTPLSPEE
jgi:hypothetical protein